MKSLTTYKQELKERILTLSLQEFKSKGIKAVKMDDLARQLSISKRTLYEIYANKEELLQAGVEYQWDLLDKSMLEFSIAHDYNVMDIIVEFYRIQMLNNADVNLLFYSELQKYPKVISYLTEKHVHNEQEILDFFQRGVKEGYFRTDINYQVVLSAGRALVQNMLEQQLFQQYPVKVIFINVLFVFIRGLCTQKGIEFVDNQIIDRI